MKQILHINLIWGRTGTDTLCQAIIDWLDPKEFLSHKLVGYYFWEKSKNTNSLYETKNSRRYRNIRYKAYVWLNFLFDWKSPWAIDYTFLSQQDYYRKSDIIHLHSIQGGFFDRECLPLIAKEKKIVMTLHDDRLLSGNDTNNNLFPYKTRDQYLKRKAIFERIPVTYVGVSKWMSNKIAKDSIIWKNQVLTIYNGIDTKLFNKKSKIESRKHLGLPLDKILILSIAGSWSKSMLKGLSYVKKIANSYKNNPDFLFVTLGNHKKAEFDNILELPFVSKEEMASYFSAADIFLYPSLADSFWLVVAESISSWCPVVSFNTWGIPEIAKHKINWYIAEYKDFYALMEGFKRTIQHKDSLHVELNPQFSLWRMLKDYKKLYSVL